MAQRSVILFDGVCHLCNRFVRFVIERDAAGAFDFAPLQSPFAEARLDGRKWDSVVLLDGGNIHEAEDAALRILARLRSPWPAIARALAILPRPVLSWGYRVIARYRYALFGRDETCALPRPEWKGRFIE